MFKIVELGYGNCVYINPVYEASFPETDVYSEHVSDMAKSISEALHTSVTLNVNMYKQHLYFDEYGTELIIPHGAFDIVIFKFLCFPDTELSSDMAGTFWTILRPANAITGPSIYKDFNQSISAFIRPRGSGFRDRGLETITITQGKYDTGETK